MVEPIAELTSLLSAEEQAVALQERLAGHSVTRRLYVSHFLSTWNSRFFEFGAVLFIAAMFPQSLLPVSIYALFRAAAAALFSSLVGTYVDTQDRLRVVTVSIVGQRSATVLSCIAFLALDIVSAPRDPWRISAMLALPMLASVEKLCSMMNTIAVERDWVSVRPTYVLFELTMHLQVVVIAEDGTSDLKSTCSTMSYTL